MKEVRFLFPRVPVVLLIALASLAIASPATAEGPGWTTNSMVVKLVVTSDGGVNVRLSPDLTACTYSNSNYGPSFASIYPTHPGINRIKADLLAAYLTGKPISLYLVDGSCRVGETLLGGW